MLLSSSGINFHIKSFEMKDTVKCPLCDEHVKIYTKITNKINGWVIANFITHFTKKHIEKILQDTNVIKQEMQRCTNILIVMLLHQNVFEFQHLILINLN